MLWALNWVSIHDTEHHFIAKISQFRLNARYIIDTWTLSNPEPSPSQANALQTLLVSNIEEGMGHNVRRTQELQQKLPQRKDH